MKMWLVRRMLKISWVRWTCIGKSKQWKITNGNHYMQLEYFLHGEKCVVLQLILKSKFLDNEAGEGEKKDLSWQQGVDWNMKYGTAMLRSRKLLSSNCNDHQHVGDQVRHIAEDDKHLLIGFPGYSQMRTITNILLYLNNSDVR